MFNWMLGEKSIFDWHQVVLLPFVYILGVIPALLTGAVDFALARRRVPWRPLWTGLFGFMASFIPLGGALIGGFVHGLFILLFGFVGAVPAALCSWLSSLQLRLGAFGVK